MRRLSFEKGPVVTYSGLIKRLVIPEGFQPPDELDYGDLRATPIDRSDLSDDVSGINESLDIIRQTRGGRWPTEPVTEEGNYVDLVWHEAEHRDGIPTPMSSVTPTADTSGVSTSTLSADGCRSRRT